MKEIKEAIQQMEAADRKIEGLLHPYDNAFYDITHIQPTVDMLRGCIRSIPMDSKPPIFIISEMQYKAFRSMMDSNGKYLWRPGFGGFSTIFEHRYIVTTELNK